MPIKTLIMGAAGRDFHNFNTFFRGNKDYEVVAFTATQIPDIEGRLYPAELAGERAAVAPGGPARGRVLPEAEAVPPAGVVAAALRERRLHLGEHARLESSRWLSGCG